MKKGIPLGLTRMCKWHERGGNYEWLLENEQYRVMLQQLEECRIAEE